MYFYHVDMARRLQTGMTIELSPQTLSVFGKNYWNKFLSVGIKSIPPLQGAVLKGNSLDIAAYREFWLEVFRTDHPELKELSLPSRLNSFFAVESIEDAYKYISRNSSCDNAPIFEIYSQDPGLKLDMTWLDQKFPKDFRQFGYYYLKYWKGERIENDPNLANHEKRGSLIEVLLGGSIEVGKVITKHV